MTKSRISILLLGPIPIVCCSMALSHWARSQSDGRLSHNRIIVRHERIGAAVDDEPEQPATRLDRDCDVQAASLRRRLAPPCAVLVRTPYVLAGDLTDSELDRWHRETIRPAAAAMLENYFRAPPDAPITVMLFSGEDSYNHYTDVLFGERNVSVYGYYKPARRTLVMNIDTGGGTLVHELTHALMAFDFPDVPDWLNEGLASMHEQCRFRGTVERPWIEGLVNWRLPALQEAIHAQRLRSLRELIRDDDFRGRREAINYAQARYFCMFMQQQGVLVEYFQRFRDGQRQDPRGEKTLAAVFPGRSWDELDARFQQWALAQTP